MGVDRKERIALASFPRSGNTWVRFLTEKLTGECSGSVYQDRILLRPKHGIVIKTHELDSFRYTKAIHVVRNPFDAIYSYYLWKRDIAGEYQLWSQHIQEAALQWKLHTEHWCRAPYPVLRIRFEDLSNDIKTECNRLLGFLHIKRTSEQIQQALEQAKIEDMRRLSPLGNKFFRSGNIKEGKEHFSSEERQFICRELGGLVRKYSYEY